MYKISKEIFSLIEKLNQNPKIGACPGISRN
jgi:hypothetical protein